MGLRRVRAVFFDLDNTLIDTAGASRKGMLEVTFLRPLPSSSTPQPLALLGPRPAALYTLLSPYRGGSCRGAS